MKIDEFVEFLEELLLAPDAGVKKMYIREALTIIEGLRAELAERDDRLKFEYNRKQAILEIQGRDKFFKETVNPQIISLKAVLAERDLELREARIVLAFSHGHNGNGIYADDGELQCPTCMKDKDSTNPDFTWDYARKPLYAIIRWVLAKRDEQIAALKAERGATFDKWKSAIAKYPNGAEGCCCLFDDNQNQISWCSAHAELREQIAGLKAENEKLREACVAAREFIVNGIEYGYIQMPEPGDSAHATLPKIIEALQAGKEA